MTVESKFSDWLEISFCATVVLGSSFQVLASLKGFKPFWGLILAMDFKFEPSPTVSYPFRVCPWPLVGGKSCTEKIRSCPVASKLLKKKWYQKLALSWTLILLIGWVKGTKGLFIAWTSEKCLKNYKGSNFKHCIYLFSSNDEPRTMTNQGHHTLQKRKF